MQKPKILPTLLWSLMFLFAVSCITDKEEPEWYLQPGDKLPEFQVTTLDGKTISSADSYKTTLIIIFFNTTCIDCQRELPILQQQYEANLMLPEEDQSQYICISRQEAAPEIETFWQEHNLTLPVASQPDRTLYSKFASIGIPRIFHAKDGLITYSE